MMGIEEAGIAETIDFILRKFSAEDQQRLVKVRDVWFVLMVAARFESISVLSGLQLVPGKRGH